MRTTTPEIGAAPLSEQAFLILLSLASGPCHGYAIAKDVNQLSSGRVKLGTGTLYGALKRLEDMGWIRREEEGDETDGRGRKSYALTWLGKRVLQGEFQRLDGLVKAAHQACMPGLAKPE